MKPPKTMCPTCHLAHRDHAWCAARRATGRQPGEERDTPIAAPPVLSAARPDRSGGRPVTIVIDSRIRLLLNLTAHPLIDEPVQQDLRQQFSHHNPKYAQLVAQGWGTQGQQQTIRTWRTETGEWEGQPGEWLSLPRGGMPRVQQVLRHHGLAWQVHDRRSSGDPQLTGQIPAHQLVLRDYQGEMVVAAVARENCMLHGGTGCGKTVAAFGLAAHLNVPTLVIVWSGNLFDQWVERCRVELGLDSTDIGMIRGGDEQEVRPITIAMQQTLAARPEWMARHAETFGLVVCDEVQRFAARTLFEVVDPFAARYRVGISADSSRKDKLEFLIHDLFGSVAYEARQADLIASGAVLDVAIRVVPTSFTAPWYPKGRAPRPTDFNRVLKEMIACPRRNALVIELAAQQARAGHAVLVWSHRVEHCHTLDAGLARAGVRSGLLVGGAKYEDRFVATRKGIESGKLKAAVGTLAAVAQAIDIPRLSRGILTTPLAGNRQQFAQARGRICRTDAQHDKQDAELFVLWDRHIWSGHLNNLIKWYGRQVTVLHDGRWVDARQYLHADREERTQAMEGIFE